MQSLRAWLRQRPVAAFYGLSLLLSWSDWLGLLAAGQRVGPGSTATHFPGLLGPLLAALIVSAAEGGRAGLVGFAGRLLRWPRPRRLSLALALSPLLLGLLVYAGLHAAGRPWPASQDFARFPGLPGPLAMPWVVLLVLLVNGLGEEGGWRGFALQHLQACHGPLGATLRLTGLWALWHAPLFWLNQGMQALLGPALLGWLLGLLCGAFVLAQVQRHSGGSAWPAACWHAGYNLMVASAAGAGLPAALCSALVMVWGTGLALREWRRARPLS